MRASAKTEYACLALVKLAEDQFKVWLPMIFGGSGNYEIIVFGVVLAL